MFYAIVQAANHGDDSALRTNCRKMFVRQNYTNFSHNERFPADPTTRSRTPEIASIQELIGENVGDSNGWLLDLVNAAKKKPLDEKNVTGYFASINFDCAKPMKIAKFINTISPYLEDIITVEAQRNLLSRSVWTDYRVARCSTGKILHEHSAALRLLGVIDDAIVADINAANAAPWDITLANAIPERVKGYCAIYLDASGRSIDNWYQGNKGKDSLSAAKVRAAKTIFKKYLETVNETTDIEAATTSDGVVNAIPNGFFA
jgi:hypothetical protein